MAKAGAGAKGKIHVTGQRAGGYTIWRPGDTADDPPQPLQNFDQARIDIGAVAWVRPTNGISKPIGDVDTKRALAGLLECDTDFRFWLDARDVKYMLAHTEQKWSPPMMRELRGISMQNTRRQRRFDKRLENWVNKFGPLDFYGTGEPDFVDDIMRAVHALRAWAIRDLSLPERVWSRGTFWLKVDEYRREVNEAAGKCARDPETGQWEAPTLWSALCHSIQHAPDYGWRFAECAEADCFNIFLKRRTEKERKREHVTCSQRCGKRMRDREKRRKRG